MSKKENILAVIAVILLITVFLPAEIAVFKSWRCALTDSLNWDGRIEDGIKTASTTKP